ncbi:MAG: DEAD/DEAH box helicase [Carboxylicivirga sp.]|jgi:hypothetical protein|nr:DEAD/DEAH box helicase [Carboxylicivirga sp.]
MSYINGLTKATALDGLSSDLTQKLIDNPEIVKAALAKSKKLAGLGYLPDQTQAKNLIQTFDEVVSRYNQGITKEEIQAWVWYRRCLGIPMNGWNAYYLKTGKVKSDLLIAAITTNIKDNHFRDIRTVPQGSILGTATKKTHEYDGVSYNIVRTPDNELVYVVKADIKSSKNGVSVNEKELIRLVKAGALYYTGGELLPEPIFAFGNIYDKLVQLQKDAAYIAENYGQKVFDKHYQVLEARKPNPLTITHEVPGERPHITPYSDFSLDYRLNALRPSTGVILEGMVSLTEAFKEWLESLPIEQFKESSAHNIWEYYVSGRYPSNRVLDSFVKQRMQEMKKAGSGVAFTDQQINNLRKEIREDIKSAAKNEGEKLYSQFLYEAIPSPIQKDIDKRWNHLFNGDSEINYTRIPMGCELSATWNGFPWEMKPVQREGVGFMEAVESGILAFDVGVGKTLTAIVELAQALHDGKCKRALVCVPNGVYEKWKAELFGQYDKKGNLINTGILSGTGIKLNEWGNLGSKWLPKIETTKVPEKSITLVNYNGLVNIGFSMDVAEEFIDELRQILTQSEGNKSAREEVKESQKILETIGKALEKNIAQIDKVGFDYLVIDEAHNFKNIFSQVKKKKSDKKRRFNTTSGNTTDRGVKAFLLANYIQRKYGKNIMLLSATPFTNQPIEVYSMLSLVGYDSMKRRHIQSINDFFELHVREEMENVVTIKETIEPRPVVKAFNNRLLLQSLIYNHIIYRTADGEKRPEKVNLPKVNEKKNGRMVRLKASDQILTYLKMTPMQRDVQNTILNGIEQATKSKEFGQMLAYMSLSLNNALSPFIALNEHPDDYKEFVQESPKIEFTLECIRSVKQWHEKHNEPCSGQIIYINRGKEFFKYIKEWLEKELNFTTNINYKQFQKEQGIKPAEILDIRGSFDEVMIIEGGNSSPEKKDAIKEAFNAGLVKVIIGTSTISEGMDFQKRGTCIYNCYPEYNPTQIRQLEGRIWRFGNPYEYVRIALPLVQDSMDVFIFQKLEEKTARINDIWYRSDRGNVLDMDGLNPEEVKFALITKIDEIANIIINRERKEAERKIGIVAGNVPILKTYKRDKEVYENRRRSLVQNLYWWKKNLERNNHVVNPLTDEALKAMTKEARTQVKKDLELYRQMQDFEVKGDAVSDAEITVHVNRLQRRFEYFDTGSYEGYKLIRNEIVKTEKLINNKGFSKDDDLDTIIANFEKEVEQLREELTHIHSEEHLREVMAEVKAKKSALKVEGKSVKERVVEFAKLNSLLAYYNRKAPFKMAKKQSKKRPKSNIDVDIALLEAEAQAELLLLELLTL